MAEYISDEFLHTGEYISRDDTLKAMQYSCQNCDNYNGVRCKACADADNMDIVSDMPAADVQPVKHGQWIAENRDKRGYADCFTCTNCKNYVYTYTLMRSCEFDYCPNCGALMND